MVAFGGGGAVLAAMVATIGSSSVTMGGGARRHPGWRWWMVYKNGQGRQADVVSVCSMASSPLSSCLCSVPGFGVASFPCQAVMDHRRRAGHRSGRRCRVWSCCMRAAVSHPSSVRWMCTAESSPLSSWGKMGSVVRAGPIQIRPPQWARLDLMTR